MYKMFSTDMYLSCMILKLVNRYRYNFVDIIDIDTTSYVLDITLKILKVELEVSEVYIFFIHNLISMLFKWAKAADTAFVRLLPIREI